MGGAWKKEYGAGRKTVTSSEVKARYNRKHYDCVAFRMRKGGRDVVAALADSMGLSMSEYIRHLIIADAKNRQNADISAEIGGGGSIIDLVQTICRRL